MLIGLMTFISAAAAAGLTLSFNGFDGFGWLWLLPVGFFGAFLAQLIVLFLIMVLMAKTVKMDQVQEKDSKFFRFVIDQVITLLMVLLGIKIETKGLEKKPKDKRILLVCNHLNDVDPPVLLHFFKEYELAFISKRENDKKFLIGPFLRAILCQPINRENDREALKTILHCIDLLKRDEVSIAVFPEGYTSMDGLLHPFRPGVFKIAQRTKVPVVVCTLRDTQSVFPNALKLRGSRISLSLLGVIRPEEYEGLSAVELSDMVHKMMADDLGPELVLQENT